MRLTRWAVFASLWLLAVGVVGTATWYAIDSAGRSTQVLASSDGPDPASRLSSSGDRSTPSPEPTSARSTDGPSQEPTDDSGPSPDTATSGSSSTTVPQSAPSTGSSSRSQSPASRPSSRTSSSSSSSSSSEPGPQTQSQLVKTVGGSVTITCRDNAQIDFTVRPAQGWRGDANQQGAQEADIKFSAGRDVWDVHAQCVSGTPTSTVEHKQHDD